MKNKHENEEQRQEELLDKERVLEPILEMGSSVIRSHKGTVHILTIVG